MYGTPWLDAALGHPESVTSFLALLEGKPVVTPPPVPQAPRAPVTAPHSSRSSDEPQQVTLPAVDLAPLLDVNDHDVFRNASSDDVKPEVIVPPATSSPFDEALV